MTKSQVHIAGVARSVDRLVQRPYAALMSSPDARATVAGLGAVILVTVGLTPLRDTAGSANVGLVLALIVAAAGWGAGRRSGLIVAFAAAAGFALLHAVPHGLPTIEDEQDAVTAGLLLATGAISGWLHRRNRDLEHRLASSDHTYGRLHELAEAAVDPPLDRDILDLTSELIRSELHLDECRWEWGDEADGRRRLGHNGMIDGTGPYTTPEQLGDLLAGGITLDSDRGRFALRGRVGAPASRHQLKIAVIMADIGTAAAFSPNPGPAHHTRPTSGIGGDGEDDDERENGRQSSEARNDTDSARNRPDA